ncbi:hypothetical protein COO60DRAFT_436006 [Scenedesmus sp. NREL 46B-D3]|nr:hypothetical protein COO60DRAFT_436006 [Scenedesmus sp. NREL 46B-D3]
MWDHAAWLVWLGHVLVLCAGVLVCCVLHGIHPLLRYCCSRARLSHDVQSLDCLLHARRVLIFCERAGAACSAALAAHARLGHSWDQLSHHWQLSVQELYVQASGDSVVHIVALTCCPFAHAGDPSCK